MAIYFAGYLSPIRNKLGNAVGRKWRTLDVLSVYNGRPRNPRTTAQQEQRAKFGYVAKVARAFSSAVELGFKPLCDGTPVPQRSMFIKNNIDLVDVTDMTNPTIDLTEVVCAEGGLPNAAYGNASFADPLSVSVPLTDTTEVPGTDRNDNVYMFVYNKDQNAGILSRPKKRNDDELLVTVPATWNGEKVHVYGFVVGGGATTMGTVSNSIFIGQGNIS